MILQQLISAFKGFSDLKMNLLKKKNNKKNGAVIAFIMLASFIDFREEEIPIPFILVAYWTAGI